MFKFSHTQPYSIKVGYSINFTDVAPATIVRPF